MDRTIAVARTCSRPFDEIADELDTNAAALLQSATDAATSLTNDIVLTLDTKWAWFDVHEQVHARIGVLRREEPKARLPLSWDAAEHSRLLPAVVGNLDLYALSSKYTEITYTGQYAPPRGIVNNVSERLVSRRVIEAAIGHLLDELVARLERPTIPVG